MHISSPHIFDDFCERFFVYDFLLNQRTEMDFDSFSTPVAAGGVMPRWKRKANQSAGKTLYKTPKRKGNGGADRFITNPPSEMDIEFARMKLFSGKENAQKSTEDSNSGYKSAVAECLFGRQVEFDGNGNVANKILQFGPKAPEPKVGYLNPNRVLYEQNVSGAAIRKKKFRHIPLTPEKILDAPALLEDYYLNLLDWSDKNIVAVALSETVYLWNAQTGQIETLCETSAMDDCVTSVSWMPDGKTLAVGTNHAQVQLWDAQSLTCVRSMTSHSSRVGALAWNGPILTSGSRDGQIHNHDVRARVHHVASMVAHEQEVCGLKWSPNGRQLASGANDNLACVWDMAQQNGHQWTPKYRLTAHTAAVKALAWCPWQTNLLATGGGTADRHLRFWNTANGSNVGMIDTKSQVTNIVWNPHEKELVTSHGYSQNQLTVWKYPSLVRMAELRGHTERVLHMALSPDGTTVVSGAADETLRFWKVFATTEGKNGGRKQPKQSFEASQRSLSRNLTIR